MTNTNLSICQRCEHRQRKCNGFCPCLVTGRSHAAHARAGECPLGKFTEAERAAAKRTPPKRVEPVPRDQWPLAVRVVARLAIEGEKGIGDTLKRLIVGVGGEQFTRLMHRIGVDCGCAGRQAYANARYPYEDALGRVETSSG